MLKVYGNAYSDKEDQFKEIVKALEDGGFEIAYNYENSGIIMKEVETLHPELEEVTDEQ